MIERKSGIPKPRVFGLLAILSLFVLLLALMGPGMKRFRQNQLDQRLIVAVQSRNSAAVTAALADGADPNTRAYDPAPPIGQWLRQAVYGNFRQNRYWRPVLFRAVNDGNTRVVQLLLDHGADANSRDAYNLYVLPLGTHPGIRMVDLLLHHGLSQAHKNQALWVAATHRDSTLAKFLIAQGADVDAQDQFTRISVLQTECLERNHSMVKFLLAHRANPKDILGKTARQDLLTIGPPDAVLLHLLNKAGA